MTIDKQDKGAALSADEPNTTYREDLELDGAGEDLFQAAAVKRRRMIFGGIAALVIVGVATAWFLYSRTYECDQRQSRRHGRGGLRQRQPDGGSWAGAG